MPSCSKSPLVVACLLSSLMGCSASTGALLELSVLTTEYAPLSSELLRWGNLAIYLVLAPMAWFVCQLFQTGRRWLALARLCLRLGAKLPHPVYAPDLHPCTPGSPRKIFAVLARVIIEMWLICKDVANSGILLRCWLEFVPRWKSH